MLEIITKLLVLQDRDRKILSLREELAHIEPERQALRARGTAAQSGLDGAKTHVKHLESERKRLELEVEEKKQLIEKYSLQQFQTKKNEEYRALTHEIEMCKDAINEIEDRELEIMEQIDAGQKVVQDTTRHSADTKKTVDSRLADLDAREKVLRQELAELEASRDEVAGAVDAGTRNRYERLLRSKGNNVVVGIHNGVCGGCHMTLSRQIVVSCCADQEIQFCPNCARILYYTPDMELAAPE